MASIVCNSALPGVAAGGSIDEGRWDYPDDRQRDRLDHAPQLPATQRTDFFERGGLGTFAGSLPFIHGGHSLG